MSCVSLVGELQSQFVSPTTYISSLGIYTAIDLYPKILPPCSLVEMPLIALRCQPYPYSISSPLFRQYLVKAFAVFSAFSRRF